MRKLKNADHQRQPAFSKLLQRDGLPRARHCRGSAPSQGEAQTLLPVWRPAGDVSDVGRLPDRRSSKPHGQTVQESLTFDSPMVRFHARSPQSAYRCGSLFQRAVVLLAGFSTERFNKRQHSTSGLLTRLLHRARLSTDSFFG